AIGEDRLVKIADGLIVAVEFGYAEQNRVGSQTMFDIAGHQLIIGVPRPAPGLWFDAIPVKRPAVPARAKLQRALVAYFIVRCIDRSNEGDAEAACARVAVSGLPVARRQRFRGGLRGNHAKTAEQKHEQSGKSETDRHCGRHLIVIGLQVARVPPGWATISLL